MRPFWVVVVVVVVPTENIQPMNNCKPATDNRPTAQHHGAILANSCQAIHHHPSLPVGRRTQFDVLCQSVNPT
jgi:hypothetical protein